MVYREETELKKGMREKGILVRVAAGRIGIPPSTLSAKLNGYIELAGEERRIILSMIREAN